MLQVTHKTVNDDSLNDQALPIPIQIFLWRQISPFIRPKLGKLHEASCMELKEACKSFEKVLVQNILFGLSPSLTEAIQSIPRWRLIQASLPHVMHALANFLHNRVKDLQTLGTVETKLIYTLHWIILDAADECAEADYDKGLIHTNPFHYLFSIPSITLFIYLFAPLAHHLKESDFQNIRLENGLKMWQALWEFRQPDAPCFTTHVKPKPKPLGSYQRKRPHPNIDVFFGRKSSKEDGFFGAESPPSQTISVSYPDQPTSKQPPGEEDGWLASPKDTVFPETIPEESSSTEEEHVVIFRLPSMQNNTVGYMRDPMVYTADASLFQLSTAGKSPMCTTASITPLSSNDSSKMPLTMIRPLPQMQKMSSSDKESLSDSAGAGSGGGVPVNGTILGAPASPKNMEVSAATFLDVATLRCLFVSQWHEEGVYWALHYIYNRLRDISEDMSNRILPRKRSNSLPIPKIEVSIYQSPESKKRDSLKNFVETLDLKEVSSVLVNSPLQFKNKIPDEEEPITRRASEKVKKKKKMADLKAFVETKLLSKSEKTLEKIGHDDSKQVPYEQHDYHRSLDTNDERPSSALGKHFMPLSPRASQKQIGMPANLIKGKSMPSLRYIGELKMERSRPSEFHQTNIFSKRNPIITVTEHTPTPSPDYLTKTRQGSIESQMDSVSMQGQNPTPERKPSLTRSQTDSNITYIVDEIQEAPGSLCYITKDGDIDFQVVLKAIHAVAMRDGVCCTVRVIEAMLNIVEILIEIGILKNVQQKSKSEDSNDQNQDDVNKENKGRDSGLPCGQSQESTIDAGEQATEMEKEDPNNPHTLILDIIFRMFLALGCSSCGSSSETRSPAAECIRVRARASLRGLRGPPLAKRLGNVARSAPLPRLLKSMHGLLAYCRADKHTLLSPISHQKRGHAKSPDTVGGSHGTYGNNFGAGFGGYSESIEAYLVENMFGILVTRFAVAHKELKQLDNMTLYSEIRQLTNYVKESHGGEFRLVALSGLFDTADRPDTINKDSNMQTTRVIRHIHHSDIEERESDTGADSGCATDERSNRKFLFKKRSTSSTCASLLDTDPSDESTKISQSPLSNMRVKRHALTPRQSERTLIGMGESTCSNKSTVTRSKFDIVGLVRWFRRPMSSAEANISLSGDGSASGASRDSSPPQGRRVAANITTRGMQRHSPFVHAPHLSALAQATPLRSQPARTRVTHTLHRARRRVEDRLNRFGLKKMNKKDGSSEESPRSSGGGIRRGSSEALGGSGGAPGGVVVLKRRRLVRCAPLYRGLLRFSFLLDAVQPGDIPDAPMIAALLDLPYTAVVGRACVLLECCALVNSCNKGQWPASLRAPPIHATHHAPHHSMHHTHMTHLSHQPSHILHNVHNTARSHSNPALKRQKYAGKLFHQWAEVIGNRLEEMMQEDKRHSSQVAAMLLDPEKQKDLLQQDEEEDFLDEASLYLPGEPIGAECPVALRFVACILLFEITAFLRETYRNLPKINRASAKEKPLPWERVYSITRQPSQYSNSLMPIEEANRRWSMALSSMGQSAASASLQSIADERKISFVLHEPENLSEGSSNATLEEAPLPIPPPLIEEKRPRASSGSTAPALNARGRPFLLRRGTQAGPCQAPPPPPMVAPPQVAHHGSFKRRSLKLRRNTKDGKDIDDYLVKRTDSIQSRRKVSSLSDRSDTSEATGAIPGQAPGGPGGTHDSGGEESPGVLSDDHEHPPESPDSNENDETAKGMPWIKTMVNFMNSFNYHCSHQNFCHPYCFRRNMRASSRLIKSVRKIYGEKFGRTAEGPPGAEGASNASSGGGTLGRVRRLAGARKASDHGSISPTHRPRSHSLAKKDRIERSVIESGGIAYRAACGDGAMSANGQQMPTQPNTESTSNVPWPPLEPPTILKYIQTQVRAAFQAPMATLIKGATIMPEDFFADVAPVAWHLLLEADRELAACAASLFILCAVKSPNKASEIMHRDLQHSEPDVRINAILRFQAMWKLRYQVWPRMEDGASLTFKVPPPGIEFTLPSPKIGIESLPIVDPPWAPFVKVKDMDVTLNQERHRSVVTATKTRKKQQTEAIREALQEQQQRRRIERESFLITTIPITRQAACEPSLDHAPDDHIEAGDEETMGAGAGGATVGAVGSGAGGGSGFHHSQTATALFPSVLCGAVADIVALLDDAAVSHNGNAVYEVAYQVIWCCLVEDSALFLRHVLERLTREKQDVMFKLLRHLIRFVPRLPQQAAFALYNYIIGYVMFYVRTPHPNGQRLVGVALSVLWMVVHSVHGIMFKDLKQILRKEQCDASILLTANVPSAKKIIVHGPQDKEEGGIPSQFPVQEDTQFCQILRESLDFFGIEEYRHKEFFLIDYKTHQIHNPMSYVRDFYFFKRSQYPQLELVHMEPEEAFNALQHQELLHKFVEIGKVHLTWAILKNVDMVVQRVVFLHEELMKLPSFPRKALESDLDLYCGGEMGHQLLGLDVLHKFMWVRLIARMFEAMAGNFAYSGDIHLFLNVLNGALILHSEDSCILRYVMATYINAAFNFKNIFSTNGYLLIMPTLLQIYSNYQTNKLVTTTIEYAVKQFYLMNRKPFILQMFGSVSAILDTDEEGMYGDCNKVQSSCLFNLLLSLETPSPDPLNIAELVKEDKPLKAIDFCYHDENEMVTVLDCISLCVMVVSYAAESIRGYQMLIILEAILPCYVRQIQSPTYNKEGKSEKEIIQQLAVTLKTLVNNCEGLSKSYNGPYRSSPEHKGSSQRGCARSTATAMAGLDLDEESHSRFVSEHSRAHPPVYDFTGEDSEMVRAEYRRPRDVLLSLMGEFIGRAAVRLTELNDLKHGGDAKLVELLDSKSHVRLADIAHSLLKVSPYDPESMGCRGLQRYMLCVLPAADWSDDTARPALQAILRRLDKVFLKISKKPSIRRNTDWDAAAGLLKGVHETMMRCPYIMHWPQIKALLNTCQNLIVSESIYTEGVSSATAALMSQPPPPHFCSTVVRLIALQILNTGDSYSLEQMCGNNAVFPTQEKTENMLMNLFMPLCLRVGSGRKDRARLRQSDISYCVSVSLGALGATGAGCGPSGAPLGGGVAVVGGAASVVVGDAERAASLTVAASRASRATRIEPQLYRAAFLGLKIMSICFESELASEWGRIARAMRDLGKRNEAAYYLWSFLEFVVTHRTPLYVLLLPFIVHKLSQPAIGDHERHMQFVIRERVLGVALPPARGRGALLADLARDLRDLRDARRNPATRAPRQQSSGPQMPPSAAPHVPHHRPSLISLLTGAARSRTPADTPDHASAHHHPSTLATQRESISSGSTNNYHLFSTPLHSLQTSTEIHYQEQSGQAQATTVVSLGKTPSQESSSASTIVTTNASVGPWSRPPRPPTLPHSQSQPQDSMQYLSSAVSHPKLRFVSEVQFKHQSGETSTTPLSPGSPEDSSWERGAGPCDSEGGGAFASKPRLQRSRAQSRKTFRLRRSRRNKIEVAVLKLESDGGSTPTNEAEEGGRESRRPPRSAPPIPRQPPSTPLWQPWVDSSWDSESQVSQTSSTSGYRESYSLQLNSALDSPRSDPGKEHDGIPPPLASPDPHDHSSQQTTTPTNSHSPTGSLSCNGSGSSSGERTALMAALSQRSLLTHDARDEDTLI